MELTERELAIAEGKDPEVKDETPATEVVEESKVSGEQEAAQEEAQAEEPADEVTDDGSTEAPPETWVDTDQELIGATYGLSREDLEQFSSKEDFARAVRLLDRVKPAKTEPAKEEPAKTEAELLDEEKFKKAGYDEDTIEVIRRYNALAKEQQELRSWREQVEARHAAEIQSREIASFHAMVDSMDESRYGRVTSKDGSYQDIKASQDENRRRLFDSAQRYISDLQARASRNGVEFKMPSPKAILEAAEAYEFRDELKTQTVQKIKEQSKTRRPVASSPPPARRAALPKNPTTEELAHYYANAPEIKKLWDEMVQEN